MKNAETYFTLERLKEEITKAQDALRKSRKDKASISAFWRLRIGGKDVRPMDFYKEYIGEL